MQGPYAPFRESKRQRSPHQAPKFNLLIQGLWGGWRGSFRTGALGDTEASLPFLLNPLGLVWVRRQVDLPSLDHPAPISPGPGVAEQSLVLEGEKATAGGLRGRQEWVYTQAGSRKPQDCSGPKHILSLPTRPACLSWGIAGPFSSGPQDGAVALRGFCRGPGGTTRG